MGERYEEIASELIERLKPGFGGQTRTDFVAQIDQLTRELERIGGNRHIAEKAARVREWVAIACSPRRHAPWGLQQVERFAYDVAARLLGARSTT